MIHNKDGILYWFNTNIDHLRGFVLCSASIDFNSEDVLYYIDNMNRLCILTEEDETEIVYELSITVSKIDIFVKGKRSILVLLSDTIHLFENGQLTDTGLIPCDDYRVYPIDGMINDKKLYTFDETFDLPADFKYLMETRVIVLKYPCKGQYIYAICEDIPCTSDVTKLNQDEYDVYDYKYLNINDEIVCGNDISKITVEYETDIFRVIKDKDGCHYIEVKGYFLIYSGTNYKPLCTNYKEILVEDSDGDKYILCQHKEIYCGDELGI